MHYSLVNLICIFSAWICNPKELPNTRLHVGASTTIFDKGYEDCCTECDNKNKAVKGSCIGFHVRLAGQDLECELFSDISYKEEDDDSIAGICIEETVAGNASLE